MASTPSRKALTHERILETAARTLRSSGCSGVGVADVMKAAGLTHGGFYAHFPSRDALIAEALAHAGRDSNERLERRAHQALARGESPLHALVNSYLSEAHATHPEQGCAVAALASEMPRQAPEVQDAARDRVRALIDNVRRSLPDGTDPLQALVITSAMVGALQLARALGPGEQATAVLQTTRDALLAPFAPSIH